MPMPLRADTETIVLIGPVVDKDDTLTLITTLDISTADYAYLRKHGATTAVDISGFTWAAVASMNGYYVLTLTAGVLDTEGPLTVAISDVSLNMQIKQEFDVLDADGYDFLHAAGSTNLATLAAAAAAWGSINSGIVFRGVVSAADPGVSFTIGGLAGQGVGAFVDTTPYYAYVFRDAGGLGGAPQGEVRQVTGYTSATGLFTTAAFTTPVAVGDDVIIMSGRIAAIPEILAHTTALNNGTMVPDVNVTQVNSVTVQGTAVAGDSVRPA